MGQLPPDHDDETTREHSTRTTPTDMRDSTPSIGAAGPITSTDGDGDAADTPRVAHDSMVTVRLSEPPALTLDTNVAAHESRSLIGGELIPIEEPRIGGELIPLSAGSVDSLVLASLPTPVEVSIPSPDSDGSDGLVRLSFQPRRISTVLSDSSSEAAEDGERILETQDDDTSDGSPEPRVEEAFAPRGDETLEPHGNEAEVEEILLREPLEEASRNLDTELQECEEKDVDSSAEGTPTSEMGEMNWDEVPRPHGETKDEDQDSTATLLARLEQENDRLATNPKTATVHNTSSLAAPPRDSKRANRPSMEQLREMSQGPSPPPLRYSVVPPPPMTDLEFYASLVKDYERTAARLPTLLTAKIRKGVPPPLRGVVWQSMAGARDSVLEARYEQLSGETSPYDPMIGKDLARTFPGVDMFRDPEGEGQRMLGRVLKVFSLYDARIGYCQGLAFLVGPLLMHMPDKQAFCVLVRLMERYDLRSCFQSDLAGLHVRIFQFGALVRESQPALARHLDDLQLDPAYVSQWFLSLFAVTCPLPFLFRIYDVLLAEGAPETLMRVALSLMRRNEGRILACAELDDALQLLLSRGLWDCYRYDADDFVNDFVSLSHVVTREKLDALEQAFFREAAVAAAQQSQQVPGMASAAVDTGVSAARHFPTSSYSSSTAISGASANSAAATSLIAMSQSDLSNAASRFLGRIWASTSTSTANSTTTNSTATAAINSSNSAAYGTNPKSSPALQAPARPSSMLRRSGSKQSLASTLNSMEASSVSVVSTASTDATTISRGSSDSLPNHDSTPVVNSKLFQSSSRSAHVASAADDRYLHSQIEDLLTALTELQRNQALLEQQLEQERREREEDKRTVRSLLDGLRKKASSDSVMTAASVETVKAPANPTSTVTSELTFLDAGISSAASNDTNEGRDTQGGSGADEKPSAEDLSQLLDLVEQRFGIGAADDRPRSSMMLSNTQLREDLERAKEQLTTATSQTQDYGRRIYDLDQEVSALKDQLRESHVHIRSLHQDKQRLEKQIHSLRARASAASEAVSDQTNRDTADWASRTNSSSTATGGLREFRLGRSVSGPSGGGPPVGKRMSSMQRTPPSTAGGQEPGTPPTASEHEALLIELAQAKTAEAIARQEAEEARQKLDSLRRQYGLASTDNGASATTAASAAAAANAAATAAMGVFGRLTTSISESTGKATPPAPAAPAATNSGAANGGGFWGWRR